MKKDEELNNFLLRVSAVNKGASAVNEPTRQDVDVDIDYDVD